MNSSKKPHKTGGEPDFEHWFADVPDTQGLDATSFDAESMDARAVGTEAGKGLWLRRSIVSLILYSGLIGFALKSQERLQYAWGSKQKTPQVLGDLLAAGPSWDLDKLKPNTYVEITGVTEHRGVEQQILRDPVWGRQRFWYFRVLGVPGLWLETPVDPARFGFARRMTVAGRVVDPAADPTYAPLLDMYRKQFSARKRPQMRMIQVDLKPEAHRARWLGIAGVLLAIWVWDLMRWIACFRRKRLFSIPNATK